MLLAHSEVAQIPIPPQAEPSAADSFNRWFEVIQADTPEQIEQVYRLRYQVYCVENPFEDPAENPEGLETDGYDTQAAHSLIRHRPSGEVAGAVRLILPDPEALSTSFPIQEVCRHPLVTDSKRIPLHSSAEVSRFAISKQFRRRLGDTLYGETKPEGVTPLPVRNERRRMPHITLGLLRACLQMSAERDVTHLFAVMEPSLIRLIRRFGLHFEPLGPTVNYHGVRQPCFAEIEDLLSYSQTHKEELWQVATDKGRIWRGAA